MYVQQRAVMLHMYTCAHAPAHAMSTAGACVLSLAVQWSMFKYFDCRSVCMCNNRSDSRKEDDRATFQLVRLCARILLCSRHRL